jgi:hypothetical protein
MDQNAFLNISNFVDFCFLFFILDFAGCFLLYTPCLLRLRPLSPFNKLLIKIKEAWIAYGQGIVFSENGSSLFVAFLN